MAVTQKQPWVSPEIRRYGTFETATQCEKTLGSTDGNTFQGLGPIVCVSGS